jgi:Kef-type K+ transport system membrane component KefB
MFLLAEHISELSDLALVIRKTSVEGVLLPILVQLAIILLFGRIMAIFARKLGQPEAVGEITAGLMLGPSLFGRVWPSLHNGIFHPHIHGLADNMQPVFDSVLHWIFTILSQLGLILLLFLIGLEFDFSHLRAKGKAAAAISISGIVAPFVLGIGLAQIIHGYLCVGTNANIEILSFSLFMGAAMSITALPILGRMMMEMGITQTRLGVIVISSAAIDDVAGWIMLATVAAIVRGNLNLVSIILMISYTLGFAILLLNILGPQLRKWAFSIVQPETKQIAPIHFAIILAAILGCSIITSKIGIFAIFGAFLLGATLSPVVRFRDAMHLKLHDIVTVFFLPIFFTYTGLRTRVDALNEPYLWLICAGVIGVACLGKFGGCSLAARLAGFSTHESLCVGAMMNTRALMELIVINIGKDLGVIPDSLFCMLVLMALFTTITTMPCLLWFMRGTEIEPYIRKNFLRQTTVSI